MQRRDYKLGLRSHNKSPSSKVFPWPYEECPFSTTEGVIVEKLRSFINWA